MNRGVYIPAFVGDRVRSAFLAARALLSRNKPEPPKPEERKQGWYSGTTDYSSRPIAELRKDSALALASRSRIPLVRKREKALRRALQGGRAFKVEMKLASLEKAQGKFGPRAA